MKSSTPTAIALTLLMFLLVLIAAVFFWLYYERLSLQDEIQSAHDNARIMEAELAANEVNNLATQAARDTIMATSTSAAAEIVSLTEQLANSDQLNATLMTKEVQLSLNLEDANVTMEGFESQFPLVTVIKPQGNASFTVDQPVNLLIVASDPAGIDSVSFVIDNEPFDDQLEEDETIVVIPHSWTPKVEGSIDIRVIVTNANGKSSKPYLTSFTVIPTATSIPEPSVPLTPTLTIESP